MAIRRKQERPGGYSTLHHMIIDNEWRALLEFDLLSVTSHSCDIGLEGNLKKWLLQTFGGGWLRKNLLPDYVKISGQIRKYKLKCQKRSLMMMIMYVCEKSCATNDWWSGCKLEDKSWGIVGKIYIFISWDQYSHLFRWIKMNLHYFMFFLSNLWELGSWVFTFLWHSHKTADEYG